MEITITRKIQAYLNSFFWVLATYFLSPYFYFRIFLRKGKSKQPTKILVVSIGKIGDLLCFTPIYREIKKKFPSSHLTALILAESRDILKNNPRLDEIIVIEDWPDIRGKLKLIRKLRKEKYDWALSFSLAGAFFNIVPFWSFIPNRATLTYKYSGEIMKLVSIFSNYRSEYKRHVSILKTRLNLLKLLGIENPAEEKEIFITSEEDKKASLFLSEKGLNTNDLLISICPTAGLEIKEWFPENFAKLADLLIEKLKAKIIFIGSSADQVVIDKIQKMMQNSSESASGFFKLHELPAFLKKMKVSISVDTGPLYIAHTVGTPVVDIIGPNDAPEQTPLDDKCQIVKKNLYCAPCLFMFSSRRFCKEGHLRCLKETTPEEVFAATLKLINKQNILP